jgi:thymidylate synthase (FAD)
VRGKIWVLKKERVTSYQDDHTFIREKLMTRVEPKIFFLGEPKMHLGTDDDPGVAQWLRHIGGSEALACMSHVEGADIERMIELLARRCYKSYAPGLNPNVTKIRTDSGAYHGNIAKSRHGSVVANGGMVTYAFEDVSRVFSHEICRNAVGNERSQESLRYVRLTDLRFWIPPTISNRPKKMLRAWAGAPEESLMLCPEDIFCKMIEWMEWAQKALAEYFDIDNIGDFETKKKLTSAFRRIAPIGLATGIGISFNLRSRTAYQQGGRGGDSSRVRDGGRGCHAQVADDLPRLLES